jgi:hypothetical protein
MEICAQRYCDVPFPSYRFVPGRNAHPTADPRGHSYHPPGFAAAKVNRVSAERWIDSAEYLYGCDLYNHAYWWEAHEAWEGLWHLTDKAGVQGRFLQGLIQASACHLKRYMGHADGVRRLRQSSMGHLQFVAERLEGYLYMGLALVPFMGRFEAYYETPPVGPTASNYHDAKSYPYLILSEAPGSTGRAQSG